MIDGSTEQLTVIWLNWNSYNHGGLRKTTDTQL